MVPEEWEILTLGDLIKESAFGPRFSSDLYTENGAIGTIRTTDLDLEGNINYSTIPFADLPSSFKSHYLKDGDLLITRSGTCGVPCVFEKQDKPVIAGAFLIRFILNDKADVTFLHSLLKSNSVQEKIQNLSSGGVQKNLSGTNLKKLDLLIPPLPEQRKIAQILSTWDKAITTTGQLLANSQHQKKALMQQLLTGKKRLLDKNGMRFSGDWREYPLQDLERIGWVEMGRGKVISKKDIANNSGNYPIYSSSVKNDGLMGAYGDYMFDEELISWSVDGGGNFFYRSKHKFSVTNVSGYMRLDTSKLNYKFVASQLELLHSKLMFDYQSKAHPSVIRKAYILSLPSLDEQQKIATVLSAVDQEIKVLKQKIDYLKQEKKALMQQLLTGKKRVKVEPTGH